MHRHLVDDGLKSGTYITSRRSQKEGGESGEGSLDWALGRGQKKGMRMPIGISKKASLRRRRGPSARKGVEPRYEEEGCEIQNKDRVQTSGEEILKTEDSMVAHSAA